MGCRSRMLRLCLFVFDLINEGLHSEKAVKVKGLGTFKVIDVRERESVNVNTGERVLIESHAKNNFYCRSCYARFGE